MLRTSGSIVAMLAVFALPGGATAADAYPSRPIRIIVPFAPGGGTDMVARVIAPRLSERLGRSVVVDNRGGAGAIIGTAMAAKATPDGYTLLVCDTAHTIQPVLQPLEYDPVKSFALIASLVKGDSVLVVPSSVAAGTVREFIALAKQKPGQLIAGTAGAGSSGHMSLELFRVMAGIDVTMAHYKGAGAATIDLLAGQIHLSSITIQAAVPHMKSGRIKALGSSGDKRNPVLPDVPTVAESGVPGYYTTGWRGIMGPAGMPAAIQARLAQEVKAIVTSDEVRSHFAKNAMDVDYRDPREFAVYINDEIKRWSGVVQKAGIRLDGKQ
ncbi:MAG: tripartite tricarboxylate transporter substrate binding protein [Burkholderiales bacterium]|nr:tripartite tricarboxylate transporter substrate binding protein [Burkholderiales bacterium]